MCGMWVDPHTAKHRAEHDGQPYYFCSAGCRDEVHRRSGALSRPAAQRRRPSRCRRARSTPARCTREIRQVGPGSCPICGMALEPVLVTRRHGAEPRARRHDAPVLDRAGAGPAGGRAGDGRPPDRPAPPHPASRPRTGSSCCWRRRSCCGPAGPSSCAAGSRSSRATSTCSP